MRKRNKTAPDAVPAAGMITAAGAVTATQRKDTAVPAGKGVPEKRSQMRFRHPVFAQRYISLWKKH